MTKLVDIYMWLLVPETNMFLFNQRTVSFALIPIRHQPLSLSPSVSL